MPYGSSLYDMAEQVEEARRISAERDNRVRALSEYMSHMVTLIEIAADEMPDFIRPAFQDWARGAQEVLG